MNEIIRLINASSKFGGYTNDLYSFSTASVVELRYRRADLGMKRDQQRGEGTWNLDERPSRRLHCEVEVVW